MRFGKKFKLALCLTMILTMIFGMTAFAEKHTDSSLFDLPGYDFYAKRGDVLEVKVWAEEDFFVFIDGNTDSGCVYEGKRGNQVLTIYVGENETADHFNVGLYPHDKEGCYDYFRVNVSPAIAVGPSAAPITFNNGTTGTVSTVNDAKNVLVTDASGKAIATFAVYGVNRFEKMIVGGTIKKDGQNWIVINTPNNKTKSPKTISIPEQDKKELVSRGYNGIFLNNHIERF